MKTDQEGQILCPRGAVQSIVLSNQSEYWPKACKAKNIAFGRFETDADFLGRVVTLDEAWEYLYYPEKK